MTGINVMGYDLEDVRKEINTPKKSSSSWISQLSLEHRTFEESKTPGEMYAGWNSYIFEINDGELTFTYNDGGTMTYIIYDEEWYEVLNPSELPFE